MKYDPQVTWVYLVNWAETDYNGWDSEDIQNEVLGVGSVFATLGGAQQTILDDVNEDLTGINEAPRTSLTWSERKGTMFFDDETIVPFSIWETTVEELGVEIRITQRPLLP